MNAPYRYVALLVLVLGVGCASCAIIEQQAIKKAEREAFFEGAAVTDAGAAQKAQLTQVSIDCASHLNALRTKANAIYETKNIVTSLGIVGAGVGGIIGAVDTKNTTAASVTSISGASVAALAQVITTTFADPVSMKDKYTNAHKYWADAQDDVNSSKFSEAIEALRDCASDTPYPQKQPPAGVQIPPGSPPVSK